MAYQNTKNEKERTGTRGEERQGQGKEEKKETHGRLDLLLSNLSRLPHTRSFPTNLKKRKKNHPRPAQSHTPTHTCKQKHTHTNKP
jgi:hypothetical protein